MRSRRHLGTGPARHSDDWLITYADTITLLLCMFVVLLALRGTGPHVVRFVEPPLNAMSAPPAPTFPPPPIVVTPPREPKGIQQDLENPRPDRDRQARTLDRQTRTSDATAPDQTSAEMDGRFPGSPFFRSEANADAPPAMPGGETSDYAIRNERVVPADQPAGAAFVATVAHVGVASEEPRPRVHAENSSARMHGHTTAAADVIRSATQAASLGMHEPTGDRITIFQCSDTAFFARGSAALSDAGRSVLRKLLQTLMAPRFTGYRITVEGHTDDEPISGPEFPSNWELSSARAASVVRFFVEQGIPAGRLRAVGYADTRPLAPNRDTVGSPIPENQARNRRVVVELEKIDRDLTHAGP